ncbi:macrolide ABC transporter ATP-binding protein [Candidatus Micrarchaeota archaeon CG_4_10_14_0_2_um_filter_60_11]|nr:MAG: macrolide ABC transporter ATP-binding protein [Candidatus Micrarchaeota archaeon CG1_02_60_51]PIN96268.1 MAG: macrolide ABC transporter ATP-binding protein [Candidatus Micrarchaeota archaeon CG10_big_fil_rev_8_21_14_0_10_60_32]PIO02063.1 MAG: macrolide ABC transporter ATP-binding protein [Candidatus Micrarchaeota archaeon CG09_land_8_20_14_0_10_60_16]PIY91657.1 MAG: macrolide ABC transporter ATP-binding protein [Candidatus Micrarchaeota archaeon CG_4_10_14_0_8_um_filter_60_7]PIZ90723.1 
MIKLANVKKIYRMGEVEVPALDGVSMEVRPHEFVAIMGPSGSGKSTLMNMVGCLDTPTSGEVYLGGENIAKMGESELAQVRGRKIGFVFQKFNLIPSMSAHENVELAAIFQGYDHDERHKMATKVLESMDMGKRMNHLPSQLSGGEQQRVAIARALVLEPDVILADEPTGNLDSKRGQEVLNLLKKLHAEGKTIVMVTHDANNAKAAERIVHIRDGKIEKR